MSHIEIVRGRAARYPDPKRPATLRIHGETVQRGRPRSIAAEQSACTKQNCARGPFTKHFATGDLLLERHLGFLQSC
jgi:hypothetical protein